MAAVRYDDLRGAHVLVTGGASGIGAAIVEAFVGQGAEVSVLDLDGKALAAQGARWGKDTHGELVDLRDIPALKVAIERCRAHFGPVGILVNNAARDDRHSIDEVTPEYWRERMATNLDHQFFATQTVWKDMAARPEGGSVINVGSVAWLVSDDPFVAYKTAKSAVAGLTRALARELGGKGVRVNAILPGWIMTERQVELWLTPVGEAELMRRQCLKRKLVPDDIARVALFLASAQSSAITAQNYIVDGGWV